MSDLCRCADEVRCKRKLEIERLEKIERAALALAEEVDIWAEDAGGYAPAWFDLEEALEKDDE